MRLFQKDAYIGIDFLEKKTEIIRLKEEGDTENDFSFDLETPHGKKTIVIANPATHPVNAIFEELHAFVEAIEMNKPTAVTEIDGLLAMEVAHLILQKISQAHLKM